MQKQKSLWELQKASEALPVIVALDYLYYKNKDSPVAQDRSSLEKYRTVEQKVQDLLLNKLQMAVAQNSRELPFTTLFSVSEMILLSLEKSKDILLEVMNPVYAGAYLSSHSLNVAFLSCNLGMTMGLGYKELTELGVAGLLHDIGMAKIDAESFMHERWLSEDERKAVNQHPAAGWHFLEKLRAEFPWLLQVISEEHMRENGAGYPERKGGEMHLYSRIIGLCDSFEALTHARIYRKAYHPADAIKAIIQAKSLLFAKDILRAMIESLAMFPVGSHVQLNNNKVALVVEAVPGSPLRPVVQVVGEEYMTKSQRTDLSKENNMYITGIVYDERYQAPRDLKVG
jgi:HD-GYP domain-containing protein (c-di-GMP phosphodiesterase class II)